MWFLAIGEASKFTYVEFHDSRREDGRRGLLAQRGGGLPPPYQIHTALTDNGMAFADIPKNRAGPSHRDLGPHIFDHVCIANGIEHQLTRPCHP